MSSPELLDKREARIRRMFGQIAPCYDLLNHLLSLNIDKLLADATDAARAARPADTARSSTSAPAPATWPSPIDRAASGPCRSSAPTSATRCWSRGRRRPSRPARRRSASSRPTPRRLPFPDDTFQIVTVAFGLRNVTDTDRGLAEMVRVTRPGGRVAMLEFSRPRNRLFGAAVRVRTSAACCRWSGSWCRAAGRTLTTTCPESVLEFPDDEALAERMRGHGLTDVRYVPLTFGIATLYVGVKPT